MHPLLSLLGNPLNYLQQALDRVVFPMVHRDTPVVAACIEGIDWEVNTTENGLEFLFHNPPAFSASDLPIVLFLHGNCSSAAWSARTTAFLAKAGFAVVNAEYPGYSGNSGTPSEDSLRYAASQTEQWARQRWPGKAVVVMGESIGTAPAAWLATQGRADLLVLDSPFTSLDNIILNSMPWMPLWQLVNKNTMNVQGLLKKTVERSDTPPLLVLVTTHDIVVPPDMGTELAALVEGSELMRSRMIGHPALMMDQAGGGNLGTRVVQWIHRHHRVGFLEQTSRGREASA